MNCHWTSPYKTEIPNPGTDLKPSAYMCCSLSQMGTTFCPIPYMPHHQVVTEACIHWRFQVHQLTRGLQILSTHPSSCCVPGTRDPIALITPAACGAQAAAVALTEIDEHLAIALSHVLRHGEDTRHVVVEEWILFLQSRAKQMRER